MDEHLRAAGQMVEVYGSAAFFHAAQRTLDAMEEGDAKGFQFWERVTAMLEEWVTMPSANEPKN